MIPLSRPTLNSPPADRVRYHWREANRLARLSVEEAWLAGWALSDLKASLHHGEWLPWLAAEGISHSTAKRWMRLYRDVKSSELAYFGTVDSALKSLAPPRSDDSTTATINRIERERERLDSEIAELGADVKRERIEVEAERESLREQIRRGNAEWQQIRTALRSGADMDDIYSQFFAATDPDATDGTDSAT